MKVLLVSPNPESRELMGLAVAGISRRLAVRLQFIEAANGEDGSGGIASRPTLSAAHTEIWLSHSHASVSCDCSRPGARRFFGSSLR